MRIVACKNLRIISVPELKTTKVEENSKKFLKFTKFLKTDFKFFSGKL